MSEIGKVYDDEAIEDVVSEGGAVSRDIRIASCNTLMLIASRHFIGHIVADDDAGKRAVRDIEIAKAHGHRVVVILERGQTFPPGLLPQSARVVESDLTRDSLESEFEKIKAALLG